MGYRSLFHVSLYIRDYMIKNKLKFRIFRSKHFVCLHHSATKEVPIDVLKWHSLLLHINLYALNVVVKDVKLPTSIKT